MTEAPGVVAARSLGICIRIIHPGRVTSVGEAATACGVGVEDVVKKAGRPARGGPLGLDLPVLADPRIVGRTITLGTGQRGTVVPVPADAVISAYQATIADLSDDA